MAARGFAVAAAANAFVDVFFVDAVDTVVLISLGLVVLVEERVEPVEKVVPYWPLTLALGRNPLVVASSALFR